MSSKTTGSKRARSTSNAPTTPVAPAVPILSFDAPKQVEAAPVEANKGRKKSNVVKQTVAAPAPVPVAPAPVAPVPVAAPVAKASKSRAKTAPAAPVAPVVPVAPVAPVAPAAPVAAVPSILSLDDSGEQEKPTRKPRRKINFPDFTNWSPESFEQMQTYIKYMAKNYSDKQMVHFVRRLVRQIVVAGDKKYRPVSNFEASLLKYKQRLEAGTYTDSKGRVHSFDLRSLHSLNGKWLSHYKVDELHTFDWIKANIKSPDIYSKVPAEVLMLIQVLHSKKIQIKGVVPHGNTVKVEGERSITVPKHDLGAEESLRVYVGPSVPFEKCYVIGPDYSYDPRKDGVKHRVDDYKIGFQRYLSMIPTLDEVEGKKKSTDEFSFK